MKRKRYLTVVVLFILLAVIFSGCGDTKNINADPTPKATATPSVATPTAVPATEAPATAAEPTLATTVRYVICDVLNVRAEPVFSGTDNIIGSCVYGELIDVVETGEDYYKILWFEDGYDYAYVNSGVAYTSEEDPDKMESAPLSTADPNGPTTTMSFLSQDSEASQNLSEQRILSASFPQEKPSKFLRKPAIIMWLNGRKQKVNWHILQMTRRWFQGRIPISPHRLLKRRLRDASNFPGLFLG